MKGGIETDRQREKNRKEEIEKKKKRTTPRRRQVDQAQRRVVGRDRLKSNVAVPRGPDLLLGAEGVGFGPAVQRLLLDRADGADLGVGPAPLALRVEDGVDVQARRGRPARQLAQTEDQRLLQLVGQVVLGPEEDDAALGDCLLGRRSAMEVPGSRS